MNKIVRKLTVKLSFSALALITSISYSEELDPTINKLNEVTLPGNGAISYGGAYPRERGFFVNVHIRNKDKTLTAKEENSTKRGYFIETLSSELKFSLKEYEGREIQLTDYKTKKPYSAFLKYQEQGQKKFINHLGEQLELPYTSSNYFTTSPSGLINYLYTQDEGHVKVMHATTGEVINSIDLKVRYPKLYPNRLNLQIINNQPYLTGQGTVIKINNQLGENASTEVTFSDTDYSSLVVLDDELYLAYKPYCILYLCPGWLSTYTPKSKLQLDKVGIDFRLSGLSHAKGDNGVLIHASAMRSEYDRLLIYIGRNGKIYTLDSEDIVGIFAYNSKSKTFLVRLKAKDKYSIRLGIIEIDL
ncbi:hypothetical protein DRW07_08720 [Alteromonas sediminis]|uniref:Uncharacterized protein n=1 Tax=Alteromonas sediminis TaxID=2259342 RepID=A0A3N5YDF2_9ALTE|nr:hypothetical protein [Alteromonas sediminis]RPJ67585.1 hypothetical protein DRW07_08720 [Alteromonas sediminis]